LQLDKNLRKTLRNAHLMELSNELRIRD
jgi:hypothetical protein